MKNENQNFRDPWDSDTYQTGSTEPPKSHKGLIAVLLITVIFLAGIASILGILNVKLFSALNAQSPGDDPLSLYQDSEQTAPSTASDPAPTVPGDSVTIEMIQYPQAGEDTNVSDGLSLNEIYTKNIDSVVSISCTGAAGSSSGTGVVIASNGYIVTNCHVVENARSITVLLSDDCTFRASVVGTDATTDLAVIYVDAEDLTPAQFGNSDDLLVGDEVCAIGDPLGAELRGTMTNGIVSAINRDITTQGRTMTLIQTNAALNSGNSGGPLINRYGHVIGINTMKIGDNMSAAGVEGLGFAIPSTTVVDVVGQLIEQGYVSGRPSIGISGEPLSALYQYYYRLPSGLFIKEITDGSNAAAQGLQAGDILVSLNGVSITSDEELSTFLYGCKVGDTVEAVIYRNQKKYTVKLTVEEAKG
ncbi:MAG: trypsin-like peptidase domain-containing protein [Oscillospiraceae bacterium]|nr:trypsin-like peptidase domain-containing protein [Oscillospiraceae bacterium]